MESLFTQQDNNTVIDRINRLSPQSVPSWGKMNVSQMLAHCQQPLRVGFGELKLKRGLTGILFGAWAKRKFMKPGGFGKNLPTAKSFVFTDDRDFNDEKSKLISLVQRFASEGAKGLSGDAHPFFGKMTPDEWSYLSWKHLDHHLTQFGV